ncbi:MAG: hypothetical protein HOQ24_02960 [Mycobacteriaceae bacterium]|nr:hypothetical protein [Mycobacteriaceae bacterium]
MTSLSRVFALPATVIAAAATLLAATAAPAAAQSGGKFQTFYALAAGPCVAVVDSSVHGPGYPSSASFTVSANLIGLGPCSLDVTLQWRNVATGQTGTRTAHAVGPGYWISDPKTTIFQPGFGQFVGTVTVPTPHLGDPGQVEFTVDPYKG